MQSVAIYEISDWLIFPPNLFRSAVYRQQ